MPIYEYACEKCGHEFEREQRITDDPVRTCPACQAPRARRLISRTSFVLKGGGWYNDLYASAKSKEKKADGKPAEAGGGAEAGKPAEKSEKKKPAAEPKSDSAKSDAPKSGAAKSGSGPKAAA